MRVKDMVMTQDYKIHDVQKFIRLSNQFESNIMIELSDGLNVVDAKSILGILSIIFKKGASIRISAKGNDEEEAIKAIGEFIHRNND